MAVIRAATVREWSPFRHFPDRQALMKPYRDLVKSMAWYYARYRPGYPEPFFAQIARSWSGKADKRSKHGRQTA